MISQSRSPRMYPRVSSNSPRIAANDGSFKILASVPILPDALLPDFLRKAATNFVSNNDKVRRPVPNHHGATGGKRTYQSAKTLGPEIKEEAATRCFGPPAMGARVICPHCDAPHSAPSGMDELFQFIC